MAPWGRTRPGSKSRKHSIYLRLEPEQPAQAGGLVIHFWVGIKNVSIKEYAKPEEERRYCYNQTLLPFCDWEAVVCIVKTRRWGVVDISGFWPGRALQKRDSTINTTVKRCYLKDQLFTGILFWTSVKKTITHKLKMFKCYCLWDVFTCMQILTFELSDELTSVRIVVSYEGWYFSFSCGALFSIFSRSVFCFLSAPLGWITALARYLKRGL